MKNNLGNIIQLLLQLFLCSRTVVVLKICSELITVADCVTFLRTLSHQFTFLLTTQIHSYFLIMIYFDRCFVYSTFYFKCGKRAEKNSTLFFFTISLDRKIYVNPASILSFLRHIGVIIKLPINKS